VRLRVGWRRATEVAAADRLLADLLGWQLGGAGPRVDRRCLRCGSGEHGQPYVDGDAVHVSLSRTPGLVVAAVSTAGPVGVDVEVAGSARFSGFEDVAGHPEEHAREPTGTWVRKEAALKATGCADTSSAQTWAISRGLARDNVKLLPANVEVLTGANVICNGVANMAKATISMTWKKGAMTLLPQSVAPSTLTSVACFPIAS